jgi:Kef-type K+ transport system membrane component KefB
MLPPISFAGLVVVAAIAVGVPLSLGLAPKLRLPAVVVEILAGILVGPSLLGLARVDLPIQVLSLLGLTFLLLLAGLEIDLGRLRGPLLQATGLSFLVSCGLALAAGFAFQAAGLVSAPVFVAIVLAATALGVLLPVLKDAGVAETPFGQLVIASATIADFGTILLLSLLFSRQGGGGSQLVLIAGFALLAGLVAAALLRVERLPVLSALLLRLQDTTAQIRVRGAFLLLAAFVALAEAFGVEAILGAFLAGAILRAVDRDERMTHPAFRQRLEAVGFGVFIPFFFVATGLRFDLAALLASPESLLAVPLFLVALLVVRGGPALLYRPLLGPRRTLAAGLLQATSLGFIVVAAQIGVEIGALSSASGAALIAAGLLSVLVYPPLALTLLRGAPPAALEQAGLAAEPALGQAVRSL